MSEFEKILWHRGNDLSDQLRIANRALAMVFISRNHEEARNAVTQAFAEMDKHDPFAPKAPETVTEEAHEGIKVGAA